MEAYKAAAQAKLRVQTSKGPLSVEQLFDLSIPELDALAVALETEHAQSGKKSFIKKSSPKDKVAKLKFDVVLDILETKVEEEAARTQAAEDKAFNNKILEAIAGKEDEELKGKTVKQLRAMLR